MERLHPPWLRIAVFQPTLATCLSELIGQLALPDEAALAHQGIWKKILDNWIITVLDFIDGFC